ncbi:MAG: hypothetical protein R6W72_08495 [Desulfurivibrionaceae bacterium]
MKKINIYLLFLTLILIAGIFLGTGCSREPVNRSRGIYMLLDTSGTYARELQKAQNIINYLLGSMESGESFAVARIDSGSFSEKDIIHKVSFDSRPSMATNQKRVFAQKVDDFVKNVKSSPYTDISGGMLQAVEWLNESNAGNKTILVFSDMEEELAKGHIRDFQIPLSGIRVVALNVTKLRTDIIDPREYMDRLSVWQNKVESGGGTWIVINDLKRLEPILAN